MFAAGALVRDIAGANVWSLVRDTLRIYHGLLVVRDVFGDRIGVHFGVVFLCQIVENVKNGHGTGDDHLHI